MIGTLASFISVALYAAIATDFTTPDILIPKYLGRLWSSTQFFDELIIAAIANLIAFVTVSLIVAFKQTIDTNPRKLNVVQKISTLINSEVKGKNPRHLEYLTHIIEDQLIFCPEYVYTIHLSEYVPELNSFKAHIRTTRTLINMSYENQFDHPIPYAIYTDDIIDAYGLQGEIISSRVINGAHKPEDLFHCPRPITTPKFEYEHYVDFAPGERKLIDILYWVYFKLDEKFFAVRTRYTYSLTAIIENSSSEPAVIINHMTGEKLELGTGGSVQIPIKHDSRVNGAIRTDIFSLERR